MYAKAMHKLSKTLLSLNKNGISVDET